MSSKLLWIFLLFPIFAFSQTEPRQVLEGRVISDSIEVDNITVRNITANRVAVTRIDGEFMIYAKATDTLQFTGIAVNDAQLVLSKKHFGGEMLIVKLDINVNVLDELKITDLTGNLQVDSRKIKTLQLDPAIWKDILDPNDIRNYQFAERNNTLPQSESQLQGVDFKRIYRLFFKKKDKKTPSPQYISGQPFAVVVRERIEDDFFTETLKIPHDEIGLFLSFCDGGYATTVLLDPKQEFQLIDYLVTKSAEYFNKK